MPPSSKANSLELGPILDVILDPIVLTLISQIIPFMFITAKQTSEQWESNGLGVLVPADDRDRNFIDKQVIRPGLVIRTLANLKEVNPLYQNIQINLSWENVIQESDPELCNIFSDKKVKLMRMMRTLKEIIMLMKKNCKILCCLYLLPCITLKANQNLLLKFLIQHQKKVKFLFFHN